MNNKCAIYKLWIFKIFDFLFFKISQIQHILIKNNNFYNRNQFSIMSSQGWLGPKLCIGKWVKKIVSCGGVFNLAAEQPQLFRKLPKNKQKTKSNTVPLRVAAHLLKHDMIFFFNEIIEYDITNEEPTRFKKVIMICYGQNTLQINLDNDKYWTCECC